MTMMDEDGRDMGTHHHHRSHRLESDPGVGVGVGS